VSPADTAARDALGKALGYHQKTDGTWWGTCPSCRAPDAQVSSVGLACATCRPLDLAEASARYAPSSLRGDRKLPAPMGGRELREVEEPAEEWLIVGVLLVAANFLLAAYPKTYKTMVLLELAVALTTGTPFLGRFAVPLRRRVGLVLMEDQAYRVRRRLERILLARGLRLEDVDGWLFLWFRPPLRFDNGTVAELGDYAAELDLDFLGVDSWAYVAGGDSDSSDDVTPQLQALSAARVKRPGLTVELTHHARKDPGAGAGKRLTDMIRNSSAFGAWYDIGIALSRQDEGSPVTVRGELRDHPAPDPFAFTVEDEDPAGPHNDYRAGGWLRLTASDHRPETLERRAAAEKLVPAMREFLAEHPAGVSRTKLRGGMPGTNADKEAAFDILVELHEAEHVPSPGPGQPATYRLRPYPAEPCRHPAAAGYGEDPADPAETPVGGRRRQGSRSLGQGDLARQGSDPLAILHPLDPAA